MVLSTSMTGENPAAVAGVFTTTANELAARLRRREPAALAQLYDEHAGRAFAVAMRVLRDGQLSEDVVHDAFIWIWEHVDRLDPAKGPPEALLLTVTHRRAIDVVRRRTNRRRRELAGAVIDRVDEDAFAIIAAVDRSDVVKAVRDSLDSLSPEQRDVIELCYFGGLTQAAVAEKQQVAIGTVKSRLRLALGHLRAQLGGQPC